MEKQSRVIHIGPNFYGFVRVCLENGESFQTSIVDVQCRDIRVGDTVRFAPDLVSFGCVALLEHFNIENVQIRSGE